MVNTLIKIIFSLCLLQLNCALLYPAKTPMDSRYYITSQKQSTNLLVMLPGRGEKIDSYMIHGFIDLLKESGLGFDAVTVDATLGYYYQETLIERLYEDVIVPAGKNGYKNIWIFGISLGGMGSLWYGKNKGETIKGIIVLAPFVGDKDVIDEINNAGGPADWAPTKPAKKSDYQRQLWVWLKKYADTHNNLPKLIMGYGLEDEFAYGDDMLSQILPSNHVFTKPGRHDWKTWRKLFKAILNSGQLDNI